MIGGSSSICFTLAVTVAMDGTKLPLFVMFKGKQRGTEKKQFPSTLQGSVFGCLQKRHGWTAI